MKVRYENRRCKEIWQDPLKETFDTITELGWHNGLDEVRIGVDISNDDHVATYRINDNRIDVNVDATVPGPTRTVDDGRQYILLHEFAHHAHFHQLGIDTLSEYNDHHLRYAFDILTKNYDLSTVSEYSQKSWAEAVAEMAYCIVTGIPLSKGLEQLYRILEGPTT